MRGLVLDSPSKSSEQSSRARTLTFKGMVSGLRYLKEPTLTSRLTTTSVFFLQQSLDGS